MRNHFRNVCFVLIEGDYNGSVILFYIKRNVVVPVFTSTIPDCAAVFCNLINISAKSHACVSLCIDAGTFCCFCHQVCIIVRLPVRTAKVRGAGHSVNMLNVCQLCIFWICNRRNLLCNRVKKNCNIGLFAGIDNRIVSGACNGAFFIVGLFIHAVFANFVSIVAGRNSLKRNLPIACFFVIGHRVIRCNPFRACQLFNTKYVVGGVCIICRVGSVCWVGSVRRVRSVCRVGSICRLRSICRSVCRYVAASSYGKCNFLSSFIKQNCER